MPLEREAIMAFLLKVKASGYHITYPVKGTSKVLTFQRETNSGAFVVLLDGKHVGTIIQGKRAPAEASLPNNDNWFCFHPTTGQQVGASGGYKSRQAAGEVCFAKQEAYSGWISNRALDTPEANRKLIRKGIQAHVSIPDPVPSPEAPVALAPEAGK